MQEISGSSTAQQGVVIAGAGGRMGRALLKGLVQDPNLFLRGALVSDVSALVGKDIGPFIGIESKGIMFSHQLSPMLQGKEILVDFTTPTATMLHLEQCLHSGNSMVIGTTGFNSQELLLIRKGAKKIPIVMAANFSIGINLLYRLAAVASRILGEKSDIEIIEMHHRKKIDSPSGTALTLGEEIARARGWSLLDSLSNGSEPRREKSIGFSSIRAGDIVGEHSVIFIGDGERVELTHKASDRLTFALGALRAAGWLRGRAPSLYSMQDILELGIGC